MINPKLQQIFERVRHAADFMPTWQMEVIFDATLCPSLPSSFNGFQSTLALANANQVILGLFAENNGIRIWC